MSPVATSVITPVATSVLSLRAQSLSFGSPLTLLPSSLATSRAPSTGPLRRRKEKTRIVVEDDDDYIENMPLVDTTKKKKFMFGGLSYLLTWSQIGDIPNSALEDHINSFGNAIKCISTYFIHNLNLLTITSLVCCRRA